MQRKYNIGWGRLQKLWNDKPVAQDAENIIKQELTEPAQQDLTPVTQQENIQRETEHVTNQHKEIVVEANPVRITKEPQENSVPQESIIQQEPIPHREIVVEDFYARLGRIEAKMERQTELMQNILASLDDVLDIESDKEPDTQSILEKGK